MSKSKVMPSSSAPSDPPPEQLEQEDRQPTTFSNPPPPLQPRPASAYPSAAWFKTLDLDGDGKVGAHDLMNTLFVIGASLSLPEFDKLLAEVQVDASAVETITFGKFSPEELAAAIENFDEEQLRGTLGMVKHNLVKFFSYALLMPMLNVTWPIRTIKTDTISSQALANVLIWNAGLSFTVGIWGLWVPSLIINLMYPSATILWADLMNPAIVYWIFVAFLFNLWSGRFNSTEGVRERTATQRATFSLSFLRLHDPGDKLKIDNVQDFLLGVFKHLRIVKFVTECSIEGLGDRFVTWRLENRRRSSFALGVEETRSERLKDMDPYSKVEVKSLVAFMLPATAPFIIRAVEGRAILGTARDTVCNVLLTLLTIWLWFSLYVVVLTRVAKQSKQLNVITDRVLDLTVFHRLRQLDSSEGRILPPQAKAKKAVRELSELDLSETKNIAAFFEMYKVLGVFLRVWSIKSKEIFVAGLIVVQAFVALAFLGASFTSVQLSLSVIVYIVVESVLALGIMAEILASCASLNGRDGQVRKACIRISTSLLMLEEPTAKQLVEARAFRAIADYLEHNAVLSASLFGVRITKELAVRIVGALVAATFSAVLRSGLM